ncbi:MAG: CBS domain-containing protein [Bacteroidetes bacterium]|nr:CBS domain-containing protein [Bacteroidota bacterium]
MKHKRKFQSTKEVMTKKVVFIDGMATAKEAVDLMKAENIEALIVNKRNEQDAYGILTIKDLIKGVIIPDKHSDEVNVFEIMSKPVISVPADMDVRYVGNLLTTFDLRMAPVQEGNEFIGMVSLKDMILNNLLF